MTPTSELFSRLQAALGPQYRLERELGHGGMGVVFLARDTTLDRPVAVKVVHPDLAAHASVAERFLAEARMIARLRHPSIVAVHTAGEATGVFYYVMDYVPGESLRQRLQREGQLPVGDVTRIVADLADALHAAGQAGLVHRDVKPENILLDSITGRAMLADFGIARAMAADAEGTRTGRGVAVGTPTYMSPEQAAGEQVDARSDLYALGVVAFEMLAGQPPFRAGSAAGVASMHLAEAPAPVESLRSDTPPSLARAIARALVKDPAARWQEGGEFRRAVLGEGGPPARTPGSGRRLALLGAALALAVTAGALALRPDGLPAGVNPRHSILVLPFDNVRRDPTVEWLRDGSVSMLTLNLSQWTDLTVVDHERLHDLMARRKLAADQPIGLEMARRLARDAGVWTVVLGDYTPAGDSLHLAARVYDVATGARVDVAQADGQPGDDARPLFDQLAAKLLNLSGAPTDVRADLARVTSPSLEAYRSYLGGLEELNRWNLSGAEQALRRAVALDTTFGLAYYKLSLTRGWVAGQGDSVGQVAIERATRFADRLPEHDRAMIGAYRHFLQGEYGKGREAYRQLLARDSTDADAWYGLGDVTFHDPEPATMSGRMTESLRAFRRSIALDPTYYLAYEHLAQLYLWAAQDRPALALLPNDSLVPPDSGPGRPALDTALVARGTRRARQEGIASAREWVAHQPDNVHAQNALMYALSAARAFDAALDEVTRLERQPARVRRADLPFVRARILTEAGEYQEAGRTLSGALDTARIARFDPAVLPFETFNEITAGANVLTYLGHYDAARRTLDLAADLRARWAPDLRGAREVGGRTLYGHMLQSHLYTARGGPADSLGAIWGAVADTARRAPRGDRAELVSFGWGAAVGLFLQNPADPTPLQELAALGGGRTPPELEALAAMTRGDSAAARQLLQRPDSAMDSKYQERAQWWGYRQLLSARLWFNLGDNIRAAQALRIFDPRRYSTANLDVRWALTGEARLLQGEIFERTGQPQRAAVEYRAALAQWPDADPIMEPLITRVRARLARVEGQG